MIRAATPWAPTDSSADLHQHIETSPKRKKSCRRRGIGPQPSDFGGGVAAAAEAVAMRLGLGSGVDATVENGVIRLKGAAEDAEYATFNFGLDGRDGQYFVIDNTAAVMDGALIDGVSAVTTGQLAQIAMDSDLVLGGAVQIVNTSLAERLLAERPTTSAQITAHQDDWEELAQLSISATRRAQG